MSRRRAAVVLALLATALLGAACGGSSSVGVARLGASTTSTTTVSTSASSFAAKAADVVAYSQCMVGHGVTNFPKPDISAGHIAIRIGKGSGIDPNSRQFKTAQSACAHLLPAGGVAPTISSAEQADYLRGVACLRAHGFPTFPEPTFHDNEVNFNVPPSIKVRSSQFESALSLCDKLIPAGLPYSGLGEG